MLAVGCWPIATDISRSELEFVYFFVDLAPEASRPVQTTVLARPLIVASASRTQEERSNVILSCFRTIA